MWDLKQCPLQRGLLHTVPISKGPLSEVLLYYNQLIPFFSFTVLSSTINDAVLTISPFMRADEGTYVCRTENIAGEDADVVSLIAGMMNNLFE